MMSTRFLLLSILLLAPTSRSAIIFSPQDDSPDASIEFKGIDRELNEKNYAVAARRLDGLLGARFDPLMSLSEATVGSPATWLEQLPAPQRKALAAEYSKSFAKPAAEALEGLRSARTPTVEEFCAIARRYPMTPAGASAFAYAADRAAQLGDFPGAQVLYELATRHGAELSEVRAKRFAAVKAFNEGPAIARPADLTDGSAAAKPPAAGDRANFTGPLPFDAAWFGNLTLNHTSRFMPAACDGRILLASWNGLAMVRENGETLWTAPNPKTAGYFQVDRPNPALRGAIFAPAIQSDVHGRPAVIVVRQPSAAGESLMVLRAYNANDGSLIWATETSDSRKDVSYAGSPMICGRYVYSLAAIKTGFSTASLILSAVDVSTGQAIWQTALGSLVEQGDMRAGGKRGQAFPLALETFSALSEPAVAGDVVLVAPNCGAVIAVGRFDGRIRWVHNYAEAEQANAPAKAPFSRGPINDADRAVLSRYKSTPVICGNVAVVLPQDGQALYALDRITGARLWRNEINGPDIFGLAGASGNMAVLCGANIAIIDAVNGKRLWDYPLAKGTYLTGPATVVGQTVIAPTTNGFVQFNTLTHREEPIYAIPSVRKLLVTEAGKKLIATAGAQRAFGVPPPPAPAK